MRRKLAWGLGVGALLGALLAGLPPYPMHLLILVLIWGSVYTAWSLMGRFGLVSIGHGAFLGVGAYTSAVLWNDFALSPWLGAPIGMAAAVALAVIIGLPCSRLRVVGHYFALVTLALGETARLYIVAERDITGGSLGMTVKGVPTPSWSALQFAEKEQFYVLALASWALGVALWYALDRSMLRKAMQAIGEDESSAAAAGIDVTKAKLTVTALSAALTALGGSIYGQYILYLNPETLSGAGVSLQIVFAAIAGGMYHPLGPTIGAALTIALTESLRIAFGTTLIGAANTIYGLLLIAFVIFLPRGIAGLFERRRP